MKLHFISLLIISIFFQCRDSKAPSQSNVQIESNQVIPSLNSKYDFNVPDKCFDLPHALEEISGLTYMKQTGRLVANNDEQARLFFIDPLDEVIKQDFIFGKNGDFEGVAFNGMGTAFVTESNGDLSIVNLATKQVDVKIKTALSEKNNIEGLCYDSRLMKLFFACKSDPVVDGLKMPSHSRAIYTFDLKAMKLDMQPFTVIKEKELKALVETQYSKLSDDQMDQLKSRVEKLAPSGIAFDPATNDLYVLSYQGHMLIICNSDGNPKEVHFLEKKVHNQPEAICFDNNGGLYIGSEGGKGPASICYFRPTKKG